MGLLTSLHSTFVICLFLINGAQVYCLCVMIMIQIGKSLVYLVKNDNLLKKSRKITKCQIIASFLRILMYVSALHDVGGHELSQVCGTNENFIRNDKKHRIFALQLLEYKSKPILFTILFNTLDFPSSFVNEYMRLQPLLRVKLEKQSFLRNSNLRPDSCFEGFFKICMGFFVVLMAWINDRLHGILLLGVYCFDFYEFYMNLPDNSYHVKSRNSSGTTSSSSSAVSDSCNSSGTSRESVYCCPHKYRNR